MLYSTMHQKLNVLKMALIRRDVASDIAICKQNVDNAIYAFTFLVDLKSHALLMHLKGDKRLHGEEFGSPQLKVKPKTVEESPEQHHLAGTQPQNGDAIGAKCSHQLFQHIIMLSS